MFKLNGKKISLGTDLVIGEGDEAITYPAGALRNESLRESLGILEEPDPVRPDDRFYWVSENDDGSFTAVPKDLAMLKEAAVKGVKESANSLLAPTDWKITRAAEGVKPCDQETLDARSAIRQASNENEAAINSAKSVAVLAAFVAVWPEKV